MANQIQIRYTTSVFTAAGWRSVTITANAVPNKTGKMARVTEVTAIDGEVPKGTMSRTGAKRQAYNGKSIALREQGANKRLSACEVIEDEREAA